MIKPINKEFGSLVANNRPVSQLGSSSVRSYNSKNLSKCNRHQIKVQTSVTLQNQKINQQTQQQKDSNAYNWFEQWYPINFTCDLPKDTPTTFTLLGIPLVIWFQPADPTAKTTKDTPGTWSVFKDACPHRLVPLSEGRINQNGHLECPYHGWAFEDTGKCSVIPHGGNVDTPRACATAYPAVEMQGMLWVKPTPVPPLSILKHSSGQAENDPELKELFNTDTVPIIPELDEEGWSGSESFRDQVQDFSTLLENVADPAHLHFTHHNNMSNRSHAQQMDMTVHEVDEETGAFKGEWSKRVLGGVQQTTFTPPVLMYSNLDKRKEAGYNAMTAVYSVPMEPGKSRALVRLLFKSADPKKVSIPNLVFSLMPRWMQHQNALGPIDDDAIFLHRGEQEYLQQRYGDDEGEADAVKPLGKTYYMPSTADKYVIQFRKWLDKVGGGPFGFIDPKTLPQGLSREEILDRKKQHLDSCTVCQSALQNFKKVRSVLQSVCLVFAALGLVSVAIGTIGGATGATAACPNVSQQLGSGWTAAVSQALVKVVYSVVTAGSFADTIVRGAQYFLASGVMLLAHKKCVETINSFELGKLTPPRNVS